MAIDQSFPSVATCAMSLVALLCTVPAGAEPKYGPGASDTEIKIGNTSPYSGPASAYGTIGKALGAYFDRVNDQGGINGRKIDFISLDDGYSPPKTVEQVRRLVEQEQVLLLFGNLGTATNTAIHEYVNQKGVPHLFVATGATKWDDPARFPWTMGWQPNYQTEARIYAKYILDHVSDPKVGVLYQNDDYGKDYLEGLRAGLGDRADAVIVATESYETSSPTVDSQIVALKSSGANVFVNVTTPKFAAQAIRKAYDIDWKPLQFLNYVSTSVSQVLAAAGLEKSVGIISSAYFKDSTDPQWDDDPAMIEWREWMAAYYPEGDLGSDFNVYAYTVAKTLEHVLRSAGDDLTRENIMRQAASIENLDLPTLLPGITINTGPDDFRPIEQMRLQRFNGEVWEFFGDIISGDGA